MKYDLTAKSCLRDDGVPFYQYPSICAHFSVISFRLWSSSPTSAACWACGWASRSCEAMISLSEHQVIFGLTSERKESMTNTKSTIAPRSALSASRVNGGVATGNLPNLMCFGDRKCRTIARKRFYWITTIRTHWMAKRSTMSPIRPIINCSTHIYFSQHIAA